MPAEIISLLVAASCLLVSGLVGLGVEGSQRTKIGGVFAAGWLTLMEGLGLLALWGLEAFAHGLVLGVGLAAIGFGIISLPLVHREMQKQTVR